MTRTTRTGPAGRRRAGAVAALLSIALATACGEDAVRTAADDREDVVAPVSAAPQSTAATDDLPVEVEGDYQDPPYDPISERPSDAEIKQVVASMPNPVPPPGKPPVLQSGKPAGARSLGVWQNVGATGYTGVKRVFQYDNHSPAPVDPKQSCGQAAVATVLTHWGKLPTSPDGVVKVWNRYPPDTVVGWGTTPSRLSTALGGFGMSTYIGSGRSQLEYYLGKNPYGAVYPSIVLLDNGAMGGAWWTGHYVVAIGYTSQGVVVTNIREARTTTGKRFDGIGVLDWATFEKGWTGSLANSVGMGGKFILAY